MPTLDLAGIVILLVSSFGGASLALLVLSRFIPARRIIWTPADRMGENVVFLFRADKLLDATPDARRLLRTGPDFLGDWPRLVAILGGRFPDFPEDIGALPERQHFLLRDEETGAVLEAEWRGGITRIVLREPDAEPSASLHDRFSQEALEEELATLRGVVDDAPMLVWKEDSTGAVRWANGAYVDLVQRLAAPGTPVGWPLPRVFDQRPVGPDRSEPPRRLSVKVPDIEDPIWFDSYDEAQGEDTLIFALPADKLVRAESSLREFVQTLTKTFAHLPTGLAVFDRERRLALFNPALTDLSALEPVFLSGRPSLHDFLDQLREKQRMPEPKNYKSWRQQILALENAAASGMHQETWSLPTGQTYRVTGRPHPDGAVAFLFEDITAEISLTRRFRAELELGQSVLDSLDEAIAVFSSEGSLILSNDAYETLWDQAPCETLGHFSIIDATRHWQERCRPTPAWGDLRDFVHASQERAEWTTDVRMLDGTALECRFSPLSGHATLVGFRPIPGTASKDAPGAAGKLARTG